MRALLPSLTDAGRDLGKTLPRSEGSFLNEPSRNDMSPPHFDQLFEVAQTIANKAIENVSALAPCLAAATPDAACVRGFVESFGAAAFRRPLDTEEVTRYVAFFDKEAAAQQRTGVIRQVIRAFVLSPHFLYRSELGAPATAGRFELTAYERASALSYMILDGPPDAELTSAARGGELRTKAQVEAQARRLLGDRRAARGLASFFREYLSTDNVLGRSKDAKLFPAWNATLMSALAAEPLAFVEQALWGENGRFATLFTATFTVGGKELAALYGGSADGARLKLPAGERAGVLTQAGLLATLAGEVEPDVILRGKFVRERLLCQHLPPPPPTVNAVPPKADGVHTQRERLARHSADPTCAACHRLMDPVGFLFERHDAVGRYRTTEVGKPIDTTGSLVLPQGDVPLADAVALGKHLGDLADAQRCFIDKVDAYANGEALEGDVACRATRLQARFARSGGDVLDAFLAAVTADDFFIRTN